MIVLGNDYLKSLINGSDPDSKTFLENIRSYNASYAFTSIGAQIKAPPGFGPYCFRIHGQMHHRTGTLHPIENEKPKFAQLYIYDPDEAISERLNDPANEPCKRHVMQKLLDVMSSNPFSVAYKMMFEVEQEQRNKAEQEGQSVKPISMAILQNRHSDQRRYNAQRCNEVAVVFSNADGEPPLERDALIHLRPNATNIYKTQRISVLSKNLDPMSYPLLFPNGEQGWGDDLKLYNPHGNDRSRKRITLKMYYSFHLQIREEDKYGFNPLLHAGKLTQQFIVDAYCKAEANDLNYIRFNQKNLRAEKYSDLIHYVTEATENNNIGLPPPGKKVILPSTFQGSPRNMQQCYQDAMAIVQKYGKPDLFITMTCNPKWKEIVENLCTHERAENRPDLVDRVFHLKHTALMEDLKVKHVLGELKAWVYVIEFQKRGLPHAHMLIFLKSEYKPTSVLMIDKIVSAELPDPAVNPRLLEIVKTNMIHGPCDQFGSRSPCLVDGKCSKGFPKEFQSETLPNNNGYPSYRRRRNRKVAVGNKDIDNRWVVPYNGYLSLKYACHINVEVCASVKSVKYLFKYIHKGHDCANIQIGCDEVQTHVDSRYVSPPEAIWRIYRFPMHAQSHTIYRLAVHLANEQTVTFETNNAEQAAEKAEGRDTTLTAWFNLNKSTPSARVYTYSQVPEHFVFNQQKREWTVRKRGHESVIGRMYVVNMKEGERYFLRLLLLHCKGATSYDDLRTFENCTYNTFFEAAKARGLIEDQGVWKHTMQEACIVSMPNQLRDLFAYICVFSSMADASNMWNEFREFLIEDFAKVYVHDSTHECQLCENYALTEIQMTLTAHGKKCSDYGLRNPPDELPRNIADAAIIDLARLQGKEMLQTLNQKQMQAFNTIKYAMENQVEESKCFFLDGPGGSGKTYLYKTLLSYVKGTNQLALPVASTGIASNLLENGRTYHSQFKIPLNLNETSVSGIRINSKEATTIKNAKLIIWDESTMAPAHALNCVDRLLKEIMGNSIPFGGKVILLGGDFRQCLPVVRHGDSAAVVQSSLKFSQLWTNFKILTLTTNVRSEDASFSEWLLKLGDGDLTNENGLEQDMIEIPEAILSSGNIVKDIFGNKLETQNVLQYSQTAILCPKNEDVDRLNEDILTILEGNSQMYLSADAESDDYTIEFLNSLTPSGTSPHCLNVKIGAIIILLRNLNTKRGLCNGTRLVIEDMKPNLIIARVLTGTAEGSVVFVPRIDLITDSDLPFQLKRRQFPIKLAFSMTINKAQGQTMKKVGIYLPNPVFSHGQLYVALSRAKKSTDVKLQIQETHEQGHLITNLKKVFTKNVVYKDNYST